MYPTLQQNVLSQRRLPESDAVLLNRAQLLDDRDRMLIEAVILHGQTAEQVSRLTGIQAYWIRRRTRQLVRLITSTAFASVMRTLSSLTPEEAQIAKLRYCRGLGLMEIGRRTGITQYQLRRQLDRVRGLIVTMRRGRNSVPRRPEDPKRMALRLYPKGAFQCRSAKKTPRGPTA